MSKSEGLIYEALNLLSDSVRAYVYLLLASQASARRDILYSPVAKSIYLDDFEDIIGRPVDTADDIKRYEKVLNKARSKVDFAIAEQIYMLPSDMLLKIGNIKGYNNNLLIANNSIKIGVVNQSVNADDDNTQYTRLAPTQGTDYHEGNLQLFIKHQCFLKRIKN